MGVVVAMDGPSGSGKSSTSRGVAVRLGLRYLDTGAMYRAMTWWMLEHGIDVDDPSAVAAQADAPLLVSGTDPAAPTITVDGTDVAAAIREQAVTSAVSAVSAVPEIRARLLADAGDIGVNVEDLRIDHDPSREYGLVELTVATDHADHLLSSLEDRGWTTHR